MFRIRFDRLDDQVEFIGAVDFPEHAVEVVWRDDPGFCEVVEAIDALGMVVFHDEYDAGAAFRGQSQPDHTNGL